MKRFVFGSMALLSSFIFAQTLKEMPDGPMIRINDDGSYQIMCVATATYDFNDPDDVLDARNQATMRAKAGIAKFLNEEISSQEAMEKATQKVSQNSTEEGKKVSKTSIAHTYESIRSSARALLTGVVVLEDAKIPDGDEGGYYKVMVGVSSKTIAARNALATGNLGAPEQTAPAAASNAEVSGSFAGEVASAGASAGAAAQQASSGLPEDWYVCVGMGSSRQSAVQAALIEGVSMVYGKMLENDARMSERSKSFRANLNFIKQVSAKGKISEKEHVSNTLTKTAGFVREYRIISVVEKDSQLEATVHAHIVNPRANNVMALMVYPPKMAKKLATTLMNVGPKKKMSGAEVGEALADVLPAALEDSQKFIVLTTQSIGSAMANKEITEYVVSTGTAAASELSNVGNALTPDFGLHIEVSEIKYSKKMGMDNATKKFTNLHNMTLKLSAKVMNERMGKIVKTKQITLTLDNDEISGLLSENEEVDLIEAVLMKLAEPIQEIIEATPKK